MLVTNVDGVECPQCTAELGIGFKEESTGWKVYAICTAKETSCPEKRIGKISRGSVTHLDELAENAERLLERSGYL